jgi:hypothetical protein
MCKGLFHIPKLLGRAGQALKHTRSVLREQGHEAGLTSWTAEGWFEFLAAAREESPRPFYQLA